MITFKLIELITRPPVRPMFFEFDDPKLLPVEEQFMVGPSLLVTPVLHEGKTAVTGFFPSSDGTTWRDWTTGEVSQQVCTASSKPNS
jgi:alpha-glucosidase (family GH31 glycosyl hydrolase)